MSAPCGRRSRDANGNAARSRLQPDFADHVKADACSAIHSEPGLPAAFRLPKTLSIDPSVCRNRAATRKVLDRSGFGSAGARFHIPNFDLPSLCQGYL
jgi:hypothetical protein